MHFDGSLNLQGVGAGGHTHVPYGLVAKVCRASPLQEGHQKHGRVRGTTCWSPGSYHPWNSPPPCEGQLLTGYQVDNQGLPMSGLTYGDVHGAGQEDGATF